MFNTFPPAGSTSPGCAIRYCTRPLRGDVSLYAPAESASFVAFHGAPMVLINALLHELSLGERDATLKALDRFEEVAEQRQFFQKG